MAEKKGKEEKKIVITPEVRRTWLNLRRAWALSGTAFRNTLSLLTRKQLEMLYELVRPALFKGSYVEILREHPELKEILKTDSDRTCMYAIYENVSWKLGRSEKPPKEIAIRMAMVPKIGRSAPDLA